MESSGCERSKRVESLSEEDKIIHPESSIQTNKNSPAQPVSNDIGMTDNDFEFVFAFGGFVVPFVGRVGAVKEFAKGRLNSWVVVVGRFYNFWIGGCPRNGVTGSAKQTSKQQHSTTQKVSTEMNVIKPHTPVLSAII